MQKEEEARSKICKSDKGPWARTQGMRPSEERRESVGLYSALPPMPQGEKPTRDTMSGGTKKEGRQTEPWGLPRKK